MSDSVEIGAVLTRVYYQVPEWHGFGDIFETYADASAHARLRKDTLWENAETGKPRVHIDMRWVMRAPSGVETDMMIRRVEFAPDETRLEWSKRQDGSLQVLAVDLDLHDQATHDAWLERMLHRADAPLVEAARVDADGTRHAVAVEHRSGWRLVTRNNPGAFDRVVQAIRDNLPGDPDGGPEMAATVVVRWIGRDAAWLYHTETGERAGV